MELITPIVFVPFFILLWIGVTGLTSVIGGWRGLAQANPLPPVLHEAGVAYSFQSMRLGLLGSYNSVLNITVYTQGVRIAPMFLFSAFHRPIYISYGAMGDVDFGRFIVPYMTCTVSDKKIRIYGRCVPAIREKLGPQ